MILEPESFIRYYSMFKIMDRFDEVGNNQPPMNHSLTAMQKERVNAIYHIYGEKSPVIVKLVNGKRGQQSWKTFFNNALRVYQARGDEAEYYRVLTNTFSLGEVYEIDIISRMINEERADKGLPPYIKRINHQCEDDFLTVFYVEEVYLQNPDDSRGKFVGYRPLFKVKA
jgi:hypothetical protein